MKYQLRLLRFQISIFATLSLSTILIGCSGAPSSQSEASVAPKAPAVGNSGQLSGKVLETMNSGGYTYVLIQSGGEKVWAAGPETVVQVGDTVTLAGGMPMKDFYSRSLDRTFDVIYFVGAIQQGGGNSSSVSGMVAAHGGANAIGSPLSSTAGKTFDLANIAKAEGGQTVQELYEQSDRLTGQEVLVRGRVVKYNPGIMKRNWLHLQDGSGAEGSNDITVTTQDPVELGALVTVRGKLAAEKDFGFGYNYELLVEDAKVVTE